MPRSLVALLVLWSILASLASHFAQADPSLRRMYAEGYEPSVLRDVSEAEKHFGSLRDRQEFESPFPLNLLPMLGRRARSFERAHVWAYELAKSGVKSLKVIFWHSRAFSHWELKNESRYLPRLRVTHVAPVVLVGPAREPYVLDRGYESITGPLKLADWARQFIEGPFARECGWVRSAREALSERDRTQYPCLLQLVPMYYFDPAELSGLENAGTVLREFRTEDVNQAFRSLVRPQ